MAAGKVIVYGGRGALGSTILEHFKKSGFVGLIKFCTKKWTLSIDLVANETANINVLVDGKEDWVSQETSIMSGVSAALDSPVDAIFCVAGGWAGGNAEAEDFIKNADLMWRQWTPMLYIAEMLLEWTVAPDKRPESGSLLKVRTVEGETSATKV
ncbi:hypothetical protein TELCIR_14221 [Teladorsagia circumcincta]|uniref:Uncharacterized protein n=1 Tax=Teladorsagia circumcincta TaxID=45464 RepID=A0A2G9U389_TELCI|nr:hypothetical protein TELCIR_14221 [Teladorsagia circumcincta]